MYVDTADGVLANGQVLLRLTRLLNKEILDFLVIHLEHGQLDFVLDLVGGVVFFLLNSSKNFVAHKRNNSSVLSVAHNGIRLTRSSLTIGEQTRVEALKRVIEHLFALRTT